MARSSKPTLGVIILTKDEAHNIREAIASAHFADDILVFDSFSHDETVNLARQAKARVAQRAFDDYAHQREAALTAARTNWVFFLDADERISPALAAEMRQVIATRPENGWWVPRHNYIVGHLTRGGGWFPDYQLRLLRRQAAHYDLSRPVHEVVVLEGKEGYLQEPLIHYNYHSWAQFHQKQRRYAALEADILQGQGIRARAHNFILQPLREFRRRYFTLHAYRDGRHGLRLSLYMAYYTFYAYWLLWQRQRRATER